MLIDQMMIMVNLNLFLYYFFIHDIVYFILNLFYSFLLFVVRFYFGSLSMKYVSYYDKNVYKLLSLLLFYIYIQ